MEVEYIITWIVIVAFVLAVILDRGKLYCAGFPDPPTTPRPKNPPKGQTG